MPGLRNAGRRWIGAALAAALLAALAAPAWGYVPDLDEIYRRVSAQRPAVQRAMLETRTYVFDPLHRVAPAPPKVSADAMPPELPARTYRQKIYWIRNTFLGIETYSEDGKLLHFYLSEGFRPVQGDLTETRHFTEADVVHPFLAFVASDPVRWRQAARFWGLSPESVDLTRGPKGQVLYRLLDASGKALWLESELLRPVKLQTMLEGGTGGGQQLTIEFSEFLFIGDSNNDAENLYFPRTVNYLLDGKLFKQTVLLNFDANPSVQSFPITKLRALAAKVIAPAPISYEPAPGGSP